MEKQELKNQLTSLERKIKFLVKEYNQTKDQVDQLITENNLMKSQLLKKEDQINNFQNTIKVGKIVGNISAKEGNSSELKERVDDYIKEIDKCIAHLSK